jgi:lipooligosaccharide transport system permease protein
VNAILSLPLRIVPPQLLDARRPHRLLERQWVINRAGGWWIVLSGFVEPLLYLLSIRWGLGGLVGEISEGGRSIPYDEFVAPALFAASAMNGAVYESTNVFFKLKYDKVYEGVLATPMTSGDVALGEMLYATFRGGLYSVSFLAVMWALGMTSSWWALALVPIGALLALAFSAVALAGITFMRTWADFEYVNSILLPLFLFSATFYPVSSYGSWSWAVQLSPLYHGVALSRAVNLGDWSWSLAGHVAVLLAMVVAGLSVTSRRIDSLLPK